MRRCHDSAANHALQRTRPSRRGLQSARPVTAVAELESLSRCTRMSIPRQKVVGWFLALVGILIAVFSQQIVFPGLERLLGIETIVGRANIVYQPDGSYVFTNPGAMVRWISAVAGVGLVIAFIGAFVLFRARREHRVSHLHANAT